MPPNWVYFRLFWTRLRCAETFQFLTHPRLAFLDDGATPHTHVKALLQKGTVVFVGDPLTYNNLLIWIKNAWLQINGDPTNRDDNATVRNYTASVAGVSLNYRLFLILTLPLAVAHALYSGNITNNQLKSAKRWPSKLAESDRFIWPVICTYK